MIGGGHLILLSPTRVQIVPLEDIFLHMVMIKTSVLGFKQSYYLKGLTE